MEKYAIYTLFDDSYFKYGIILLYSFFKYNKWFDGDFFIINDSKYCVLSDENKEKIKKISGQIKFLDIKNEDYAALMNNQKRIALRENLLQCFFKLEIFNNKYDKILWLDSDILILQSIEELFTKEEFNGKFCACLDCSKNNKMFIKRGMRDYFNGGVYRIDKDIKKKYPYEELKKACETISKEVLKNSDRVKFRGGCVDQDFLNYYIKDEDTLIIPYVYNVNLYSGKYNSDEVFIFHYYGPGNKPNERADKCGRHNWFFDPWHKMHDEVMEKLNG